MRWIPLMLALAVGLAGAEEPTAVSGKIKVADEKAYALAAANALKDLENPLDPKALDAFIRAYPESDEALYVFAVRMTMLEKSPVAEAYHEFIATYADRVGARMALSDLFQIYRRADRLSAYLDFMRRYPGTAEAEIAEMHVHRLAFELACRLDTAEDYDGFTRLFPGAAQAEAAADLAVQRSIAEERALYEKQSAELAPDALADWVNRRLRNMVFRHRDLWMAVSQENPPPEILRFVEDEVLGRAVGSLDGSTRSYLARRVARIYAVVRAIEPYRLHAASDQILAETRHQELIEKLEQIRSELEAMRLQQAEILREEFARTRETLREGFETIAREQRLNAQVLVKGFEALAQGMDLLHRDMVAVHGELRGIRFRVDDLRAGLRQTNELLFRLDGRLAAVNRNLYQINADLNAGLDRVATGIERMHVDMNANFDRQAEISIAQLEVAEISLDVQTQTLYTVDRGFQQIDATLRTGFTRLEDATWGSASMIADSNRQLVAQLGSQSKKKSSRGGGVLGSILGTAATFAGAGPILGPVIGDMAGHVLGAAIDGEAVDPLEVVRTGIGTAAQKRFKGVHAAGRVAEAVFDKAILERRNGYSRTAETFQARSPATRPPPQPWPEIAAGCSTPNEFDTLERRIAEMYHQQPGTIEFCATRIQ